MRLLRNAVSPDVIGPSSSPDVNHRAGEVADGTSVLSGHAINQTRTQALQEGMTLVEAGTELLKRFKVASNIDDLHGSISLLRAGLEYFTHEKIQHGMTLNNLATALLSLYEKTGDMDALNESIELNRESLLAWPPGHPDHYIALCNLSVSLLTRFEKQKDIHALAESTELLRKSLLLTPHGHPDRHKSLCNLAVALKKCFSQGGSIDTLAEVIALEHESLLLLPEGHPSHHRGLNNLAASLKLRFKQIGDIDSLTESISLYRESLLLNPHNDGTLCNLANSLLERFRLSGDTVALTEAIDLNQEALHLRPRGHPDRDMSLNSLANTLLEVFSQTRNITVLEEVIKLHRESLLIRGPGHPNRHSSLSNLAHTLLRSFRWNGDVDALTESIKLLDEALGHQPPGHPDRGNTLHNLSNSYFALFQRGGDEESLAAALSTRKQCLDAWPEGHPDHHDAHFLAANIQLLNSSHFNWAEALDHLSAGIGDKVAPERSRLRHAIYSLRMVERATFPDRRELLNSQKALVVYVSAIRLLPRVAHLGLDVPTRLRELSGSEQICRMGAARALVTSQPSTAVELLEEGRTVFWQQALQLRSSALDDLPPVDRNKLLDLFGKLNRDHSVHLRTESKIEMERQIEERRKLSEEAEHLIEEIRLRPGFDRFLNTPDFTQLCQAAASGPVVILNDHLALSFALIITSSSGMEHVRMVPLLDIAWHKLHKLSEKVAWYNLRGETAPDLDLEVSEEDEAIVRTGPGISYSSRGSPLTTLWKTVVEPVIRELGLQKAQGRDRPRLHWCPNGKFNLLPLHAAGIYEGKNRVCVSDYVVSSYTPSLSALIKAQKDFVPMPRDQFKALIVAEPDAPGLPTLYSVEEEAETIAGLMMSVSATVVNDLEATPTVQSVLDTLPAAHVLHLSCHGQQHLNPLESSFALHDGRLTISSLMRLNLPSAFLAFLSACETAKGGSEQPDQAVHLAASMLFCGFRSVIATMWAMHDIDGPQMARWIYESLLEKETIQLDDIAYALDDAVRQLRETGARPIRWATFLHMGA